MEYAMDYAQSVGKQEAIEIGPGWESPSESLARTFKDIWCVHGRDVGKCVQTKQGRCCRELFQLLSDRRTAICDSDRSDEEVEPACSCLDGVRVMRNHCLEVFHSRQPNEFVN